MKRTTERKWHSWLNGVALTICPSMWRRQRRLCWTSGGGTPLTIDSSTVERVSSTKFLGVHITEDLTWTTNTMSLSKKAQQRLHFLRRLKRASLPPPILTTFYRGTTGPAVSLSGTGTAVLLTARPSSGQWTRLQRSLVPLSHPS